MLAYGRCGESADGAGPWIGVARAGAGKAVEAEGRNESKVSGASFDRACAQWGGVAGRRRGAWADVGTCVVLLCCAWCGLCAEGWAATKWGQMQRAANSLPGGGSLMLVCVDRKGSATAHAQSQRVVWGLGNAPRAGLPNDPGRVLSCGGVRVVKGLEGPALC